VAAALYVVVVGAGAGIIPNPVFRRMVPADAGNLLSCLLPAALFGPLAATYLVPWPRACRVGGRAGTGGVLSLLAAGCPVCNKLVVLAVGGARRAGLFPPAAALARRSAGDPARRGAAGQVARPGGRSPDCGHAAGRSPMTVTTRPRPLPAWLASSPGPAAERAA